MPEQSCKKEGGTTANFQISIFALSFSLVDSGNYEMCYFKGPGGRIEASRRPLGGTTVDLWKPFGASSGSHGVLESSIEYKPVILVVRSRSKTLRHRKT